jgi:hypothetical protein
MHYTYVHLSEAEGRFYTGYTTSWNGTSSAWAIHSR